jgi:hypothetical protein
MKHDPLEEPNLVQFSAPAALSLAFRPHPPAKNAGLLWPGLSSLENHIRKSKKINIKTYRRNK